MKKLLVKIKVIDIPYSSAVEAIEPIEAIEAQPEKWVKDDLEVFEQPMIEVNLGEFEIDSSFIHHPAIEAVLGVDGVEAIPEILEVSHEEIIAQTQGSDEELAQWLAGDSFKYPEFYWVEYIDVSTEVAFDQAVMAAQAEIAKGMKGLAVFKVKVKEKGLNTSQIGQIFSDPSIQKIIATLSTGSLPLAALLIAAYQQDGIIVTEEDKAAVLAAIA
jgi:hypothetical protein